MIRSVLLAFIIVFVASCELFGNEADVLDFERAKVKWEQARIADYSYDVWIACFCLVSEQLPARVVVRGDSIVSATRDRDGEPVDSSQVRFIPTVPELFDVVEDALADADSIDVEYDSRLGFPEEVAIDYIKEAADDEIWYTISNVEIVD